MKINTLLPLAEGTVLGNIVAAHIRESGHTKSETVEKASYVVGLADSPWPADITANRRIILKDPGKVDTVPQGAILFNVFTLGRIDNRSQTLCGFLEAASDPLT
jgi:hypothetical protein